ncbi:MAG: hypothetical protein L0271_16045 [Gemmatimonadetes bacterium]|nr:hypothetical protein [Gemmatimonadota bacterium]
MRRWQQHATCFHEQVVANMNEIRSLAALRDSLLPKLLSGEIRINGAEAAISDVP